MYIYIQRERERERERAMERESESERESERVCVCERERERDLPWYTNLLRSGLNQSQNNMFQNNNMEPIKSLHSDF
jgi:hypothetical protein